MTKQEEIREGIDREVALELCLYCQQHDQSGDPCAVEQPCEAALVTAKTIREIYHSQGVVIKVDRELPSVTYTITAPITPNELMIIEKAYRKSYAGYVATEPLWR